MSVLFCFTLIFQDEWFSMVSDRMYRQAGGQIDQHTFKRVAFNYERKYLERPGKSVCIWDRGSEKGPTAYQAAPDVRRERGRWWGGGGGCNNQCRDVTILQIIGRHLVRKICVQVFNTLRVCMI